MQIKTKKTLVKKRKSAGKIGGIKTLEKHGVKHLSKIAKDKWIEYRKTKKYESSKNNKQKN